MSAIPAILARVPNQLASRIALAGIQNTNRDLLTLQVRLASGKAFSRPSEDAIGASTVSILDDAIERREQRVRNLGQADATLNALDAALADVSDILQEAKGIGLSQIGVGSDAATRANQATVIDSMINSLLSIANREQRGIHFFGGDAHARAPFATNTQGIRYSGEGLGMRADLGLASDIRLTIGGEQAFGALSGRVEGDRDLDPSMIPETRLSDLRGANGNGVTPGTIEVEVGGTPLSVDLSEADSIGDVVDRLNKAIQAVDPGAVVSIDAATGDRLAITPSAGVDIVVRDSNSTTTAGDLGLSGTYPGGSSTAGADLDPKLTPLTRLDSISGLTLPLGVIAIRNGASVRQIDLSSLETVQDFQNAVAGADMGVRVEISEDGTRMNVRNELSGASMSIEEVSGSTASELGIRSFASTTRLDDFNDGRGIRSASGAIDPQTGLPDPAADRDIRVTLRDGRSFEVEIDGAETVQDAIDLINAAAAAAGIAPAEFEASLSPTTNGIAFSDATAGTETLIEDINNSGSATDLGIAGTFGSATFTGSDRATVAVDSVFSHLIALRDALLGDDERGIEIATNSLESDFARATEARADVGVRSRRVSDATGREEELGIQDLALRSSIQDLDFTSAATRFSQLQQQLEAGLAAASRSVNLSLLDYLR